MSESPAGGNLSGRVALVTGSAGRIGSAIARRLASSGVDVALAYNSSKAGAEQVAQEIRSLGRRATTLAADLSDPVAAESLVDRVVEEFGTIDILVPNAGTGTPASWEAVDADAWDSAMAVNLRTPFLMARRALPTMLEQSWGRVLFISSVAAFIGGGFGPDYAASKSALHGLTHYLAPQVAGRGITVNVLAPAIVGEDSIAPLGEETARAMIARIPVGRAGGTDEAAAMAVSILANAYLTNKVITLDGGLVPR